MRTYTGGDNEPKVERIYFTCVGADGADPTSVKGRGITSFKYNAGTGIYQLILKDSFITLLGVRLTVINATPAGWVVGVDDTTTGSTGVIDMKLFDVATPTATNLKTADAALFEVIVSRTGQPL